MRSLIVSDIHSNLEAFHAVLADAETRGGFDEVWCLGDIVGYGPDPGECIDLLRSYAPVCVVGNHDLAAANLLSTEDFNFNARYAAHWTASRLSPDHAGFLSGLPQTARRGEFTLVHGSLRSPVVEYLISVGSAMATFELMESSICLVGHSHIPFVCHEDDLACTFEDFPEGDAIRLGEDRMIINPGGFGQPRDGDPRPSYALYDGAGGVIRRHRVAYDIPTTQGKMRRAGLPDPLIERLSFGV